MINADEFCPYEKIGIGLCRKCLCGSSYHGCARYKYADVKGIHNVPEYVGVLDHGRLLELSGVN
jgi:hypothetical protein